MQQEPRSCFPFRVAGSAYLQAGACKYAPDSFGELSAAEKYLRHLRIALGSEAELQTQIEIAVRLKLLDRVEADKLLSETSEVGRMLSSLLKSLLARPPTSR